MTQDQQGARRDYQIFAQMFRNDPKAAEVYRQKMLGKVEQDVDDRINEIKSIVSDPAKELEKAYTEGEEQKEIIKNESTDEEKKAELRKLLSDKGVKFSHLSGFNKLLELAKQNNIIE